MHPDLFTLPGGMGIKTYGFCMMVGFLSAVWMSMRRATRVKADPDVVLDLGFLSLLFGVGGARIFYVAHYWQTQFADRSNKLLAIVDITEGGLEFLGGFLGAFFAIAVYSYIKKISVRMYMDILAPGVMWGLAFGRLGCFFNGCCFGGLCDVDYRDTTHTASHVSYRWGVQFPFASPAQRQQWEEREVTIPAELISTRAEQLFPMIVPNSDIQMSVERRDGPLRDYRDAVKAFRAAKEADPNSEETKRLQIVAEQAQNALKDHETKISALRMAMQYPSRINPDRRISVSELADIASTRRSLSIHPTQLYSSIHAFILSGLLSAMFYIRKRHGVVIASVFLFYPLPRVLLESIRADNPLDVAGLTISQSVSIVMFVGAVIALIVLYKCLPERSPLAVPFVPKEEA